MRKRVLVLLTTVAAVCAAASLAVMPAEAGSDSARDLSGRWTGSWTGTGLLMSPREDAVTLHLVQTGKTGYGRFVLEGATAAESVPIDIRNAGLWGIRVRAKISRDKVTLRHEAGGHLFTAELKVAADGEHLYGVVHGPRPRVALVLTRAPADGTSPHTAMTTPPPAPDLRPSEPATSEPAPKVVVITPPEQKEEPPAPPREENFVNVAELAPIHFDFDKAELRKDALDTLNAHVAWLKDHADAVLLIEGHCDERGTDEYNVALGERRAKSVSDLLAANGISADRITTTSFGRERPVCTANTEECRMKNRRAEFRIKTR